MTCLTLPQDWTPLIQGLQMGRALDILDGSYQPEVSNEFGAAASILSAPNSTKFIIIAQMPGTAEMINAYRSELHGLHNLHLVVKVLCNHFKICKGAVHIGCDNDHGMEMLAAASEKVPYLVKHADIIHAN